VSDDGAPSFALRFFMGIAFAAAGLFPILAAFDVGPFESKSINGPPWIGVAAGAVFLTGAVFLFFHDAATRYPWLGSAFAFLIVAAFATLANWIAFGSGPRECSGTFSFAILSGARWVPELECRAAFGLGAMMCDGMLLMIAGRGLEQVGVANALPKWLEKIGTGVIVLAFAPILLVFVFFKSLEVGARWCWARITGRELAQK
jgi:hypothetical protein